MEDGIENLGDLSHPVWDVWIEILISLRLTSREYLSHPVWDVWIEILPALKKLSAR